MISFLKKKKWVLLFGLMTFFVPLVLAISVFLAGSAEKIDSLQPADAVIIFGTIVRDEKISPLMLQRLETGRLIYTKKKAYTIVVSNTEVASLVMRKYLVKKGVPREDIELDVGASRTVDSCIRESKVHGTRRVILVSQNYHLPRIGFQCWRKDVDAEVFGADYYKLPETELSFMQVFSIRSGRYLREAALLWGAVLRN